MSRAKSFPFLKAILGEKSALEEKNPSAKPPEEAYRCTLTRAMKQAGLRLTSGRGM
jgi:hypothetical protein